MTALFICICIFCFLCKVIFFLTNDTDAKKPLNPPDTDGRRQIILMAMETAENYNASSFQVGRSWIGDDGHEYIDCSITVSYDVAMALAQDLQDEYGDVIDKIDITRNNNMNSNMNNDKQQPQVIIINENNGTVNGDYYNNIDRNQHSEDDADYADYEEVDDSSLSASNDMPDELKTDKAMAYWLKLQQKGFVDDNYQPVGLTKAQMMYIADCMSDKLRLRYKWSPFEKLWHVTRLADAKYEMQQTGILPPRSSEIMSIF